MPANKTKLKEINKELLELFGKIQNSEMDLGKTKFVSKEKTKAISKIYFDNNIFDY